MLKSKFLMVFIFTFFIDATNSYASRGDYHTKLYRDFLFAQDVQILRENVINTDHIIDRPKLVWIPLFRNYTYGRLKATCVYYLVPKLDGNFVRKGMLKLVQIEGNEDCEHKFVRTADFTLKEITGLTVFANKTSGVKKYGTVNVPPFSIRLLIERNQIKKKIDFPLYNYRDLYSKKIKRFDTANEDSFEEGVVLLDPIVKPVFKKRYIGSKKDNYPDGNLKICHDVDESCQEKTPFICSRCRHGWFEVVSGNCPSGGPKYCGPNLCGKKGWPACPRGFLYNQSKESNCFDGSNSGYCEKGLKTFCDENRILICL